MPVRVTTKPLGEFIKAEMIILVNPKKVSLGNVSNRFGFYEVSVLCNNTEVAKLQIECRQYAMRICATDNKKVIFSSVLEFSNINSEKLEGVCRALLGKLNLDLD